MISKYDFPVKIPAIKVQQTLGAFFIASIEADLLLQVSYSTPAKVIDSFETGYSFIGGQRVKRSERLRAIARYIDTDLAAFPNSIILGANYNEDGTFEQDDYKKWYVEETDHVGLYWLIIPTQEKLASIIDGQHRLFAFDINKRTMPLSCSVYLDLPVPFHSYLFATININQRKVDRSLAFELFGFSLESEPSEAWPPETVAVYLARVLNTNNSSPLYGHIQIGVQDYSQEIFKEKWLVSMATIVDGILGLITTNPKEDRDIINKSNMFTKKTRERLSANKKLPLREYYLNSQDKDIYNILSNYFSVVSDIFWSRATDRSYIYKTVGIQALFDILKNIIDKEYYSTALQNKIDFTNYLEPAAKINYADAFFQASGKGRTRIKNCIGISCGLLNIDQLRITNEERNEYNLVINKY